MDVFQLWGKIAIDNAQANSAIDGTTKKATTFGEVLKANLASEAIISGVKKLASVVTEIGKAAYESYAENEQLVGGIKKLYGDAYQTVVDNGNKAWKTAGMSANQYFNNVTGFSASLLTSLNGDAEEAARVAEMIMTDIADNANTFGKYTAEELANVYQNIAKGQYQTMDNLMLGFAGTKEGLQELIDTANDYKAANGEMADLSIDNFADIAEAIHIVQDEMGIAGTTAAEAEGTIEGSTNAMKAAWSNLATGMADETADMEQLTQDFVDSVGVAAKNILPRVQQILTGVGTATVEGIAYSRETNAAIDLVVTVLEDVAVAAGGAGAALIAIKAGSNISNIATIFKANAEALAFFTVESGKAAVAEATLNGTFSVGEIVVGVLTGKISLATAAQYAWNTAMNANPIGLVIALVSALTIAVTKSRKHVSELANSYVKQADSAAECAENLGELKTRYAELTNGETNPNKWAAKDRTEIEALAQAIEETEQQLQQLEQAEAEAAEAMTDFATETESSADAIMAAAETYAASAQAIMEEYYDTYNSIYGKLYDAAGMFTETATAMKVKYSDMMKTLEKNIQFQESFNQNLEFVKEAAEGAGVNIDSFVAALSEMDKSQAAGILAAVRKEIESTATDADGTSETLGTLMQQINEYGEANAEGADSLAQTVSNVQQKMNEALETYTAAVQDLDQGAEAIEAGKNTMEGLLSGITSGTPGVLSAVDSLASQMKSRLTTSFSNFVLNIQAKVSGSVPGHADGLDRVPYDNYLAYLHKDEAVLTASEARAWRAGKAAASSSGTSESEDIGRKETSRGVTIVQYIQAVAQTPVELAAATESYFTQARWSV